MGILMFRASKQTFHLQQLQNRASHVKNHISHDRRQPDNTYATQLYFIYIVQVANVVIVSKLANVASVDTHFVTCSKTTNNKQK